MLGDAEVRLRPQQRNTSIRFPFAKMLGYQMTIRLRVLFVECELQQDIGKRFVEVEVREPRSRIDGPKARRMESELNHREEWESIDKRRRQASGIESGGDQVAGSGIVTTVARLDEREHGRWYTVTRERDDGVVLGEPFGISGDTDNNVSTASVREQRRQPRDVAVSIAHCLRHLTEGFYDTDATQAKVD